MGAVHGRQDKLSPCACDRVGPGQAKFARRIEAFPRGTEAEQGLGAVATGICPWKRDRSPARTQETPAS